MMMRRESVEAQLRARGHANAAKLVDQADFPRPARLSSRSLRWVRQEVLEWLQANPGTGEHEPEHDAEKAAEAARASLAGALQQLGTRDPAELRQAAACIAAAVAAGAKLRKPDRMLVLSVADHATDEATWRSLCAAVAAGRGRKPRPWTSPLVCPPFAAAPRRRRPPADLPPSALPAPVPAIVRGSLPSVRQGRDTPRNANGQFASW